MLHIITVCYNTSEYVDFLFKNVKKTIGCDFTFNVIDNGSSESEFDKIKKLEKENKFRIYQRKQDDIYAPSRHHGEAIDFAISLFGDSEEVVHVDCDSAFIMKNWGRLIKSLLKHYDHISCRRPVNHLDTGPWFTSFNAGFIRKNNITFLPKVSPDGTDLKCKDRYDVGSDLKRVECRWKQITCNEIIKFHNRGQLWMLDRRPFMSHMGACSHSRDYLLPKWKIWLRTNWGIH